MLSDTLSARCRRYQTSSRRGNGCSLLRFCPTESLLQRRPNAFYRNKANPYLLAAVSSASLRSSSHGKSKSRGRSSSSETKREATLLPVEGSRPGNGVNGENDYMANLLVRCPGMTVSVHAVPTNISFTSFHYSKLCAGQRDLPGYFTVFFSFFQCLDNADAKGVVASVSQLL